MTKIYSESHQFKAEFFDGLEIGAVSVKWIRRSASKTVNSEILRHDGNPGEVIQQILKKYRKNPDSKIAVAVTGEAAKSLLRDLPYYSEIQCLEKALAYLEIKPDILLSLGGETFTIYPIKDGRIKNIISTSKCQAGSGEFIVQQFKRMGFSIEDGINASKTGSLVKLATRCSVHCKSDATHKLNKGECSPNDIAKTLIFDLAKKVGEMIKLAQWPSNLIVLTGNVTNNEIFVQNLRNFLNPSKILVLKESPYFESFGASLLVSEHSGEIDFEKIDFLKNKFYRKKFKTLPPLHLAEKLLDYRVIDKSEIMIKEGGTYILGVDAGSTTSKAVLFNVDNGSVEASSYLRTLGNPIRSVKQCLYELIKQIGDHKINMIQKGVTGSAREMVSVYLDNCLTFNEILAHARASSEEVPEVDTVFEIGGQDSKFISFLKGIPIDYAMNEGCSAGTGSFLEESASVDMGIDVKQISKIAESSNGPIAFGERCAAFINTDLRNALQQGAGKEDVVAGLVYSIADNYISRIVGPRNIGKNLLFMGGVALNKSVGLAIAARSQRKVVVPAHPELMGAWGTALMTLDLLKNDDIHKEHYTLKDLTKGNMEVKGTFNCAACENNCEIQKIEIRGKIYPFGGLCSKYWLQRHKSKKKIIEGLDYISVRNKLMFKEFGPKPLDKALGIIGLPMALLSYELFPFFTKFINELGYNVCLSEIKPSKSDVKAPICYPCELVHSGVRDLLNKNVDFIFLPYVIELETMKGYIHGYTCPNTVVLPAVIDSAFENIHDKLLSPHISLSKGSYKATIKEMERLSSKLGIKRLKARKAVIKALAHYRNYKSKFSELCETKLNSILEKPTVVLAGRPYVTCASEINLALPKKIISRGYNVIPMDFLPQINNQGIHRRNAWKFTQQISNAVSHVKENPNLYICFVSCFSCGPDATMYHHFRQQLEGNTFCYLEIDSHTAHAGFETRIGAFLDIIEERRRKGGRNI
ncbi:MAG: acyl-CoA dehydratase activase [Promethearchaeota archaeon]